MLEKILSTLDASPGPLSIEVLTDLLKTSISKQDLSSWIKFEDGQYARNRIRRTDNYEILCLCWKRGQKSPPHDHWNSSAAIRVISGTASETVFENHGDYLLVRGEHRYVPGSIRVEGSDLIHQFGNEPDSAEDLISLHIYSPPLRLVDANRTYPGGRIVSGLLDQEEEEISLPQ